MTSRDEELIARLRRAYEAFNSGDFDEAMEFMHPEIEFARVGAQAPVRGAGALRAWMEPDAFDEQRIEPLEFQVNGNRVLIRQRTTARGAGSGIELDITGWVVLTLDDDGLITELRAFFIHEEGEALKAAGLATGD